jgi:hypothetical protein
MSTINPENREGEPIPAKEVWIIDDDEETIKSILKIWQMKTKGLYNFRHFETGASALAEIKRRQEAKESLPAYIFVDGELKKDEGELKRGASLIKKIRNIKEIEQPQIIAHSTEKEFNQEMLEAGANLAFSKKNFMESAEFLVDPEKYQKKE